MNAKRLALFALATAALTAVGYALYQLGIDRGMKTSGPATAGNSAATGAPQKAGDIDPATGKKVLYWHDPMAPAQKFDKPGKSPYMDMQLAPVYADGDADAGSVSISSRVQQNLGVRTAPVRQGTMSMTVEAVGSTAYNERDVDLVQARSNGFLERLYVRAPLDPVRVGQPLAELYVPDWVAVQEEYLSAKRIAGQAGGRSIDGL